jgi:hypothetical protein
MVRGNSPNRAWKGKTEMDLDQLKEAVLEMPEEDREVILSAMLALLTEPGERHSECEGRLEIGAALR